MAAAANFEGWQSMSHKTKNPTRHALLPGFGPKSTQALAKIGITTVEQLNARDAYEIYACLKQNVSGTSRNFLYGIIAAQEQKDWREIAKSRRTEILLRLDELGLAPK
ncbi:TfoX/Sxy family DNA transformation protein [Ideonella sp. B508-1]|uniref:TfoX/Sxy family DNA transformation protein n=1 Tax=Ideonella sp. B508-1 TaxID=137716 RepID=UPI0018FFAAC1|nr:TfoX/Sxy family DNA transformation protein [Ideonella sp. B508-1]